MMASLLQQKSRILKRQQVQLFAHFAKEISIRNVCTILPTQNMISIDHYQTQQGGAVAKVAVSDPEVAPVSTHKQGINDIITEVAVDDIDNMDTNGIC